MLNSISVPTRSLLKPDRVMKVNLFIVVFVIKTVFAVNYPKCCNSSSVLKKNANFSYECTEDALLRLQIISNQTNAVKSNNPGLCVDIDETVNIYQYEGSNITFSKSLNIDYFSKCCPLNHFYNTTTHGCVKSSEPLEIFFKEKFVKVGLPLCKIIVDLDVNASLQHSTRRKEGFYCMDKDALGHFIIRVCETDYTICETLKCVHKCCPDGQSFINGSHCHNTYVNGLDLSYLRSNVDNYNDSFAIIHGFQPPVYTLSERFHYHLDQKGEFSMVEVDMTLEKSNFTRYYEVAEDSYCIEHAVKQSINNFLMFREAIPGEIETKFFYTRIATSISCVSLAITIAYYCFSKQKRSIFGKTLISYCLISMIFFLLLTYLSFDNRPSNSHICRSLAFLLIYSSLSSFTWMNIMCIDIYLTFGSSKSFINIHSQGSPETRQFILYSAYGWGFPALQTALLVIFYHAPVLPDAIEVLVNIRKCFIHYDERNFAKLLFHTSVLAFMQVCNLILFIKTIIYCLKIKKEIASMNVTHAMKSEKKMTFNHLVDRFGLLIKLFVIMGVSFLFEVASTFYNFKKDSTMAVIEIVWDTFNCLQGLFIFVIFIAKKKNFENCGGKVGLTRLRKFSLGSTATTLVHSASSKSMKIKS